MFSFRSVEATGRTEAYGGDAQSGDAKEEGNAAQVFYVIKLQLVVVWNRCCSPCFKRTHLTNYLAFLNRQEEERRRQEEEMLRKRELEEQMRRQREENYRMGSFMDVS